jgi:excisionase family DNA binding protein
MFVSRPHGNWRVLVRERLPVDDSGAVLALIEALLPDLALSVIPVLVDAVVERIREHEQPIPDARDDVFSVDEAATFLKVSASSIYDALGRGELPHCRVGKHIRLSRTALVRFLASCGHSQLAKKGQ